MSISCEFKVGNRNRTEDREKDRHVQLAIHRQLGAKGAIIRHLISKTEIYVQNPLT